MTLKLACCAVDVGVQVAKAAEEEELSKKEVERLKAEIARIKAEKVTSNCMAVSLLKLVKLRGHCDEGFVLFFQLNL